MPIKWINPKDFERDGTSQPFRPLDALAPDYVAVDERTTEHFIEFAREYGRTLRYVNADGKLDGDFRDFIGNLSAKQAADFLRNPDAFDPDVHPALFRPHFTLFAAFLKLLQHTQTNLNSLTRRHLEYHFQRFMQFEPRPAVPDQLNLVFSLAEREANALVPAGTLASAGVDTLGVDRLYKTSTNLVVNRANIETVSSVFVERSFVSLLDAWRTSRNDGRGGRFAMARIVYGRPLPGDPLPNFTSTVLGRDVKLDTPESLETLLTALQKFVGFAQATLKLSLADLRIVMNKTQTPRSLRGITIDPGALTISDFAAVKTLDAYWNGLRDIEAYFGMSIESFEQVVPKLLTSGDEWNKTYDKNGPSVVALLETAYHDKRRAERRVDLKNLFDKTKADPKNPGKNDGEKADVAYSAIMQQALYDVVDGDKRASFIAEFEDALRTYLTDEDARALHDAYVGNNWETVLDLLAHAMTLRIGKAPPRKINWKNIHPAADARAVLAKRSKTDAEGNEPFSTFGGPLTNAVPASVLGFAITSPILQLAEGVRTITLTLGLRASGYDFEELMRVFAARFGDVDSAGRNLSPLAVEVSTAKGWIPVKIAKSNATFGKYDGLTGITSTWNDHTDAPGLKLVLELKEGDPAIAPLPNAPDGMDPRYPAIRILMRPVWSADENRYVTDYRALTSLFVGAVHIKVTASGLLPTAIENDESLLDPKKPLEPFGTLPAVGSRLSFGHPEIATKKIDRLKCLFQWVDAPASMSDHYSAYGLKTPFTAKVRWVDVSGPRDISASGNLFGGNAFDMPIASPMGVDHVSVTKDSFAGRVKTWRRFLQWELNAPHFQHSVYASKAAEMAMKLAIDLNNPAVDKAKLNVASYQVNAPYTPKLAHLKLEYDSSVEILLYSDNPSARLDRTYHVHPFGCAELTAESVSEELPLVPRYDAESELCIGLSGVSLPETVTILFRLDEGSGDRDIQAPAVTWSQLSGNRWKPLGRRVLLDETIGLQKSGVVALSLERALPNTILPANLTWVRASITQDHASICDTRALHTQAVLAVFEDRGNAPDHYRAPLAAKTITNLKSPIAGIVGVLQPDPSFGGRPAEDQRMFSTRVSERLRHKQRALSTWDYERIVLDAFPQIFKAKCIPMPENEPGRVDVLVIPDVRMLPTNELGPKAPIALLSEIERYLQARVPTCARVRVRNATFRAVRLRVGVRFTEIGNDGYWIGRLNEELNRFLSPWAYDDGVDIVVGGRIHASNIVNFVDRCEYVDYVAGVSLFYTDDEGEQFRFLVPPTDGNLAYCVEAEEPDRVLVAFPRHRIDVITSEHYDALLYRGISQMEMEMDFVVG